MNSPKSPGEVGGAREARIAAVEALGEARLSSGSEE